MFYFQKYASLMFVCGYEHFSVNDTPLQKLPYINASLPQQSKLGFDEVNYGSISRETVALKVMAVFVFYSINVHAVKSQLVSTHTHPFKGPFSGTTWVSRYQKGKTNLNLTESIDSEC